MPQDKQMKIQQMAEIFTMVERGEMGQIDFFLAFKSRFREEINKARNRWRTKNTGWENLDWSKIESDPFLSQLLN